jgi:hypothetical protein
VTVGNWKRGEFVADVFEGEFKAVSEPRGIFNGVRAIAKLFSHFSVALQITLGVLGKEFPGGVEMSVFADAGEDIENLAAGGARVLDAVGGDHWEAMRFREVAELLVGAIFSAEEMALDFHVDVFAAERID